MKPRLILITYFIFCSLLAAGILFLISRQPRGSMVLLSPPPTPHLWVIQITGAVSNPGIYELPAGSRVREAVQAAGGMTPDANPEGINLAALLADGQLIFIPAISSTAPNERGNSLSVTLEPRPTAGTASTELININTATLEELDKLPEIGPKIAQLIIDYRTANGPFATIDEIMSVKGIGPAIFDEIKSIISTGP